LYNYESSAEINETPYYIVILKQMN